MIAQKTGPLSPKPPSLPEQLKQTREAFNSLQEAYDGLMMRFQAVEGKANALEKNVHFLKIELQGHKARAEAADRLCAKQFKMSILALRDWMAEEKECTKPGAVETWEKP